MTYGSLLRAGAHLPLVSISSIFRLSKLCRCCTRTCSIWALVCPWWPFSSPPCSSTGTPLSICRRSTEIASPEPSPPPEKEEQYYRLNWWNRYIYSPLVSVSNHHLDIGDENHPTSSWRPFGTCLASAFVPLAPWPFEPCKGEISNVFPQLKKIWLFTDIQQNSNCSKNLICLPKFQICPNIRTFSKKSKLFPKNYENTKLSRIFEKDLNIQIVVENSKKNNLKMGWSWWWDQDWSGLGCSVLAA